MGYSTHYSLTWEKQKGWTPTQNCGHNPPKGKFCPECGEPVGVKELGSSIAAYIKSHDDIGYAINADGSTEESCKWYEHDKDMVAMSLEFPGVIFKLHGEGEESGDIWDSYYLNGKTQTHKAKVMIDEVDPSAWK
jgi:hypothetical protein